MNSMNFDEMEQDFPRTAKLGKGIGKVIRLVVTFIWSILKGLAEGDKKKRVIRK